VSALALLALAAAGVVAMVYFGREMLLKHRLGALSLPLLAVVAAAGATFNPCALPGLPAFFAFSRREGARGSLVGLGLAAGLGAMTAVVALGVVVSILGMEAQLLIAPHFRRVQVGAGVLLVALAVLHFTGQAARLPLLGHLSAAGGRIWDRTTRHPNPVGAYFFGLGFVAVGGP
jgi:cytochrome c biogenesis protein CcdA